MITKRNIFISVSNMRNTVMYDGVPNLHSDNFGAQITRMINDVSAIRKFYDHDKIAFI